MAASGRKAPALHLQPGFGGGPGASLLWLPLQALIMNIKYGMKAWGRQHTDNTARLAALGGGGWSN